MKKKSYNGIFLVKATEIEPTEDGRFKPDIRGKKSVYLTALTGGPFPNRNIISGTVAENAGFKIGTVAMVAVTETAPDPDYGRQFQFTVVVNDISEGKSITETMQALNSQEPAVLYNVETDQPVAAAAHSKIESEA